jgi:hypothetical protein
MPSSQEELLNKVIGSLVALAVFSALIKYAFAFTWFQGFVLGYFFWLIQDKTQTIKNKD